MYHRRKIALRIGVVILFCLSVGIFFLSGKKIEENYFAEKLDAVKEENGSGNGDEIYYQEAYYKRNTQIDTFLFLGIDQLKEAKKKENTQQADFLLVFVINHKTRTYQGLMLNRDTMTKIKTTGSLGDIAGIETKQIALAHAYGADEEEKNKNTKWAVENLLYKIPIDACISFTMDAVPLWNDFVGGVPVTIKDDFSNIDDTLKIGEKQILKGRQSLIFVQARKRMEKKSQTNTERMKRQKQYLKSFMKCAESCADKDNMFYIHALDAASEYLEMDCSAEKILQIDTVLRTYTYQGITSMEGESKKGEKYMEFYVAEDVLKAWIMEEFFVKK